MALLTYSFHCHYLLFICSLLEHPPSVSKHLEEAVLLQNLQLRVVLRFLYLRKRNLGRPDLQLLRRRIDESSCLSVLHKHVGTVDVERNHTKIVRLIVCYNNNSSNIELHQN